MTDKDKKKPSWLRHLVVNKVSLVDPGNPEAFDLAISREPPDRRGRFTVNRHGRLTAVFFRECFTVALLSLP